MRETAGEHAAADARTRHCAQREQRWPLAALAAAHLLGHRVCVRHQRKNLRARLSEHCSECRMRLCAAPVQRTRGESHRRARPQSRLCGACRPRRRRTPSSPEKIAPALPATALRGGRESSAVPLAHLVDGDDVDGVKLCFREALVQRGKQRQRQALLWARARCAVRGASRRKVRRLDAPAACRRG